MSFACRTIRGTNTVSSYDGQGAIHAISGGVATAINFQDTGAVTSSGGGGANFASDWFIPHNALGVGSFWIRWTLLSGNVWSTTPGATGLWLPIVGTLTWNLVVSGFQDHLNDTKFEIASDSGGSSIVCTGHITAEADGT